MFRSTYVWIMYVMLSELLKKHHSKRDVPNDAFCFAAITTIRRA